MMDLQFLSSESFWEDPSPYLAAESMEKLPETAGLSGAVVFQTSGSTGVPKWIVHEKRRMLISANAVNRWLEVDQDSRWGLALPIDHMGGFSIFARVYAAGCGLARFDEKWNPERFLKWISEQGVTHVSLVPTQVHDLVKSALTAPRQLKAVVVGGGQLTDAIGQAARDLGWPVLASFGMTEAGSQIATQSIASLGLPFSEGELEILPIWQVDSDADQRLKIAGEALFRGDLFQEQGGMKFKPILTETFLTHDRGIVVGNHLKPLGRMDALVKVLGVLVDLEAVERKFLEVAGGRVSSEKFAVIALPDLRNDHVLVAVFEGEIPKDCVEEYQRVAPGLEQISEVFLIEKFPRSSLGKLRRGEIVGRLRVLRSLGAGGS